MRTTLGSKEGTTKVERSTFERDETRCETPVHIIVTPPSPAVPLSCAYKVMVESMIHSKFVCDQRVCADACTAVGMPPCPPGMPCVNTCNSGHWEETRTDNKTLSERFLSCNGDVTICR